MNSHRWQHELIKTKQTQKPMRELDFSKVIPRQLLRSYATSGEGGQPVNLKGSRLVMTGERGINKVTLLGRAGQDSQMRGSADNPVAVFPLATSYTLRTAEGEFVQKTEWHRVSVFRPVLKDIVSQNVKKGDRIYIQGSLSYSEYKDKNEVTQRVASIIAEDVLNLSRSMSSASGSMEPLRYGEEEAQGAERVK